MSSQVRVELDEYRSELGFGERVGRVAWCAVYLLMFRFSPTPIFRRWRVLLLRLFRARVDWSANVYPSARIWAPWRLKMGSHSCIAAGAWIYNVGRIELEERALVSQRVTLCAASHDIRSSNFPLQRLPITIRRDAWIAAEAFVAGGVTVGSGAVVGARAVVSKCVDPWVVVAGNPARVVGQRELASHADGDKAWMEGA